MLINIASFSAWASAVALVWYNYGIVPAVLTALTIFIIPWYNS